MRTLGNSPAEKVVLKLEARKSYSLRVELVSPEKEEVSWDNLSASFTMGHWLRDGTTEPFLELDATDGVFRFQAADLDLQRNAYPFTITGYQEGYSSVLAKGEVLIQQNTETDSLNLSFDDVEPADQIRIHVGGLNVLRVELKNSPILWEPQDLTGYVETTDPRLSDARHPTTHSHGMLDITGLAGALAGKADTSHVHDDRYYTQGEVDDHLAQTITLVWHGSDAVTVRPDVGVVWWIGSAEPVNALPHDVWDSSGN